MYRPWLYWSAQFFRKFLDDDLEPISVADFENWIVKKIANEGVEFCFYWQLTFKRIKYKIIFICIFFYDNLELNLFCITPIATFHHRTILYIDYLKSFSLQKLIRRKDPLSCKLYLPNRTRQKFLHGIIMATPHDILRLEQNRPFIALIPAQSLASTPLISQISQTRARLHAVWRHENINSTSCVNIKSTNNRTLNTTNSSSNSLINMVKILLCPTTR